MWRLWWAACPLIPQWKEVGLFAILPCTGRASHQPCGFPVLMREEEGGPPWRDACWIWPDSSDLKQLLFPQLLRNHNSHLSCWNNCLVHFFSPFVSFWVTTALSLSGLSLCSSWWRAGQAQCWGWEFVLGSFFRRAPIAQVVSICGHQEVPYIKLSTGVSETLIHRCYSRALSAAPSSHSQHIHLSCRQLQKWLWWNLLSSSCLTSLFQMTAHHLSLCRPGSG